MADAKDADPLATWRDLLGQWEQGMNAIANRAMGSDEYSSSMNGAMGATLKLQETMRQYMAVHLANANLPSRAEMLAIAERIGGLEARLDRMTGLLERIAAAQVGNVTPAPEPPRARPPRTRKPPSTEPAP